jgi:hypothetical protein
MALKDLIRPALPPPTPAAERPPGITCEKFLRSEGRRCAHYLTSGACALATEFMCVEWLKLNGPNKRGPPVLAAPAVEPPPVVVEPPKPLPSARDLFGKGGAE